MKKLLLIIPFLFFGCDTPQEKNRKEIIKIKDSMVKKNELENLKLRVKKVEDIVYNKTKNKELHNLKKEEKCCDYIVINPTTLITINKAKIYSKPEKNSSVITEWDKCISFTSYKEKNGFIKVTGYFIDGKWTPNRKEWWIKKSNVKIKRKK